MLGWKGWARAVSGFVALLFALSGSSLAGSGQGGSWELRVCLEPNNPPASDEARGGYEVEVASLLARDLGARVSFVWIPITPTNVRDYLRAGLCDVVMGVPDGFLGLTTTVPYYQIPHVFLYRKDAPQPIGFVDDPRLQNLRIGTYALSQLDFALRTHGLKPVNFRPPSILNQLDVATPLVQGVLNGDIDAAVLSGSVAAYFVRQYPNQLQLIPVTPELVELNPMFQMGTLGLRPGETELRDLLNIAITRRWDEIQGVFQRLGVPLTSLPQPSLGAEEGSFLKVGLVAPFPTGFPSLTDAVGRAAQLGAMVAEDLLGDALTPKGLKLKVLLASAPNAQAAQRAAQRLVQGERVVALIGGLGEGQAQILADEAEKGGVLFLNIGSLDSQLRQSCHALRFHVEASLGMYLDALVEELTQRGHRRWFVLYPATEAGRALYRSALEAIRKAGAIAVAHAEIPIEQRIYDRAIRVALQVKADIILSLLSPENQDFFLAQMKTMGVELAVASFSDPVAQTRSYWLRMRQAAFRAESSYRVDLWEANLWEGHAGELNDQFGSRTGVPMDPTAWATFAAVKVVVDSVLATGSADPERIAEYMASSGSRFDLYKGVPLSFRPWDHQLRQPLYLVQVNPEAEVGTRLYQQQALVRLLAQVPAIPEGVDPVVFLDRYGDTTVQHPCR